MGAGGHWAGLKTEIRSTRSVLITILPEGKQTLKCRIDFGRGEAVIARRPIFLFPCSCWMSIGVEWL